MLGRPPASTRFPYTTLFRSRRRRDRDRGVMDDDFVATLRARSAVYWEKHPFQQAMLAGELPPAQVRSWVANRWYYQKNLPPKDAAIIANCPEPEVRRRWLERIVYHDGPRDGEGGLADWLRLCDA